LIAKPDLRILSSIAPVYALPVASGLIMVKVILLIVFKFGAKVRVHIFFKQNSISIIILKN